MSKHPTNYNCQIYSICVTQDEEDEEERIRRVGFALDGDLSPDKEGKLRRRDTPHHLKNKRINASSAKGDAEEKVRLILAQVASSRLSSDTASTSERDVSPEQVSLMRFLNWTGECNEMSHLDR